MLLDDFVDYYEVMQISPNADSDTLHRVYRILAQRFHPDNQETGDPEQFRLITEAYGTLGDPTLRIAYDVKQIDHAFSTTYAPASAGLTNQALVSNAQARWQTSLAALQDALKVQAGVVANLDTNRIQTTALVTSSQSATGALQAAQAGNQLAALQAQQLADLTATVAAQGRAQNLEAAQRASAQDQGREQLRRFLNPGVGYQPTSVQMFH